MGAHEKIAARPGLQLRKTVAGHAKKRAGLSSSRHFYPHRSVERRDFDFAAQRGQRKRDRSVDVQVGAIALEALVFADANHHVEISGSRATLSRFSRAVDPKRCSVL